MKKRTLIAWSGGKDSAWALKRLREQADIELAGVFTTVNEEQDRVAVHAVRLPLLRAQAEAARMPLHTIAIPSPCTNELYESRLGKFLEEAKSGGVSQVAFGDLFLEDIRRYRERQFAGTGLELLFPLWGTNTAVLAEEMTDGGLRAWITCVDPGRVPRDWAGRLFDPEFVRGIPQHIDPCGENGEFHTFVVAGPMLSAPVSAKPAGVFEAGGFVYADFLPA
jgi:uncharacterized protein (TIGR00290 family)